MFSREVSYSVLRMKAKVEAKVEDREKIRCST